MMPCLCDLRDGARRFGRLAAQTANLMVGLPDYDAYVAHCRDAHPDTPPMTRDEFVRDRQAARFGGKGSVLRCC